MSLDQLFSMLWNDYCNLTPQASYIKDLLTVRGERVVNDHIALRTFNDPRVDKRVLSRDFCRLGYEVIRDDYQFEKKKLSALHMEHMTDPHHPKIFISELDLSAFSDPFQSKIESLLQQVPLDFGDTFHSSVAGPWWTVSHIEYETLRKESEYAAWVAAWGFRANHFTVSFNHLTTFESLQDLNKFLRENGFHMNTSGGEVKGSPEMLLEQSSTLASYTQCQFIEDKISIPSCYYEFARRYRDPNTGVVFQGFIADSADKIFESTDTQ